MKKNWLHLKVAVIWKIYYHSCNYNNHTYWVLLICFLIFFLCLKYTTNIATAIINSASGTASAKTIPIIVPLSNELLIRLTIVDGVGEALLTSTNMNENEHNFVGVYMYILTQLARRSIPTIITFTCIWGSAYSINTLWRTHR